MKKAIYLLAMFAGLLFASCEKDEIGGTATESMAGEWYVVVEAVDASNNLLYSDDELYGLGHTFLYTYNTASNSTTQMYVDDMGNFWEYKVRVNCDLNTMTFSTSGSVANEYYDCGVTIEDGKIIYGGTTSPHGTPADYIEFYVTFSDDQYVPALYNKLKVSGYRYTGLVEDD